MWKCANIGGGTKSTSVTVRLVRGLCYGEGTLPWTWNCRVKSPFFMGLLYPIPSSKRKKSSSHRDTDLHTFVSDTLVNDPYDVFPNPVVYDHHYLYLTFIYLGIGKEETLDHKPVTRVNKRSLLRSRGRICLSPPVQGSVQLCQGDLNHSPESPGNYSNNKTDGRSV